MHQKCGFIWYCKGHSYLFFTSAGMQFPLWCNRVPSNAGLTRGNSWGRKMISCWNREPSLNSFIFGYVGWDNYFLQNLSKLPKTGHPSHWTRLCPGVRLQCCNLIWMCSYQFSLQCERCCVFAVLVQLRHDNLRRIVQLMWWPKWQKRGNLQNDK